MEVEGSENDPDGVDIVVPDSDGTVVDEHKNPEPEKSHWTQFARLTTEDGSWFVERTWPAPTADAGKIPVRPFVGPACYVRAQYGLTLNLGRYESARIDVSLSVPCYPAEVQETYEYVSKWVSERVIQERAEIEAYRDSTTPPANG